MTPVLTSRIIGCRFVTAVLLYTVADRSGNRSVGWKTGGTSVAVGTVYFWNSQTLIGVGHLPHLIVSTQSRPGRGATIDIPLVRVM